MMDQRWRKNPGYPTFHKPLDEKKAVCGARFNRKGLRVDRERIIYHIKSVGSKVGKSRECGKCAKIAAMEIK